MAQKKKTEITKALISVSDKTGIVDLAQFLTAEGVEILSTGGTAKLLSEADIPVTEVSSHTGFPEMMGGRIKTLHPKIHGGILARRDTDDAAMQEHDIPPIDLVIVNLYPFESAIADPNCSFANAIENIDIGGPTMVRAAAKNHESVAVVVSPGDYELLKQELAHNHGKVSKNMRFDFMVKAFEHTAKYDGMIANYFSALSGAGEKHDFSSSLNIQLKKKQDMRYGENPHQRAAFYVEEHLPEACVSTSAQLQGKALSFNNIADTDTALECVKQFDAPACVIVKHANPCGVAVATTPLEAYQQAFKTDPTSAFGGIIAFNRNLDEETAAAIVAQQFVEVIVVPQVTHEARAIVAGKKNVRLLECGMLGEPSPSLDYKRVVGGLLVQGRDLGMVQASALKVVTKRQPTVDELQDLQFAWRVAKYVKSNAIVYAKDSMTIGIGAGQMSRVYSAKIAGIKAADEGLPVPGSVMASDAFFPFRDGLDAAYEAGITAVIQPGGSMRDDEVIAAADEHGMAMVFTGMRHFRH